ncbi:MAG: hypothetical protein Q9171_004807 [Xanthocarpia ochracea]
MGQKGKGKGNEKGKSKGEKDKGPTCSYKPCGQKGPTIVKSTEEIFAEVAKKNEAREKMDKDKDKDKADCEYKDNKKKGPSDVQVIQALNVSSSGISTPSSPKPDIENLRQMVAQIKTLIENTVTLNRVASHPPV